MRLISRLERLEDRFDTRRCPECGGHGPFVISHVVEDEPVPAVTGCPVCGEGVIHIDRDRTRTVPDDLFEKPLGDDQDRLPRWDNHLANWVQCVRDRSRPICDVEVGAHSVAVCHLLNQAYFHRRELRWDPQAWRFVGDDEANGWLDYNRRAGYEL